MYYSVSCPFYRVEVDKNGDFDEACERKPGDNYYLYGACRCWGDISACDLEPEEEAGGED